MVIILILAAGMMAGCAETAPESTETAEEQTVVQTEESEETEEPSEVQPSSETDSEESNDEESDEESKEAETQKILEYLAVLGLDSSAEYTNVDWFDIDGSDEKSLILFILNISEEQFDEIEQYLVQSGYTHPQDPTYAEDTHTRFMQYSNDTLFMELGYFEDDDYINIIFTPSV